MTSCYDKNLKLLSVENLFFLLWVSFMAKQKAKENKIIDQLVVLQDKVARKKTPNSNIWFMFSSFAKIVWNFNNKIDTSRLSFNLSS